MTLRSPTETQVNLRQQAGVENLFESKKQLVLTFLDQKIGPDLRKTVKVRPLIKLVKVAEEIIASAKEEQCNGIKLKVPDHFECGKRFEQSEALDVWNGPQCRLPVSYWLLGDAAGAAATRPGSGIWFFIGGKLLR